MAKFPEIELNEESIFYSDEARKKNKPDEIALLARTNHDGNKWVETMSVRKEQFEHLQHCKDQVVDSLEHKINAYQKGKNSLGYMHRLRSEWLHANMGNPPHGWLINYSDLRDIEAYADVSVTSIERSLADGTVKAFGMSCYPTQKETPIRIVA